MSSIWHLYEYHPSFVIGFHGCDKDIGEQILGGHIKHLEYSQKNGTGLVTAFIFEKATRNVL